MNVRILRTALRDLEEGRDYYECKDPGVGDYFIDSLISEIGSLRLYGGIHRTHFGFHRMIARRFPHAIYYRMIEGSPVVFRVLDCRRSPAKIRRALGEDT